jgi:hypothetical protein
MQMLTFSLPALNSTTTDTGSMTSTALHMRSHNWGKRKLKLQRCELQCWLQMALPSTTIMAAALCELWAWFTPTSLVPLKRQPS